MVLPFLSKRGRQVRRVRPDAATVAAAVRECAVKRETHAGWILQRRKAKLAAAEERARFGYGGATWVLRWSKDDQYEFTPSDQPDLERWTRMVTINLHEQVKHGEAMAGVVANYQRAGRVVRNAPGPAAGDAAAERFVSAVLTGPGMAEAVCARLLVRDGTGLVVVSSRRAYGADAERDAAAWLEAHGDAEEAALMAFDGFPTPTVLRAALPQSR
jgi:hypothetical protein